MTDLQRHLRGILDHPEDDARPLVLADWLEEHGDQRAQDVRAAVAGKGTSDSWTVPLFPEAWTCRMDLMRFDHGVGGVYRCTYSLRADPTDA